MIQYVIMADAPAMDETFRGALNMTTFLRLHVDCAVFGTNIRRSL